MTSIFPPNMINPMTYPKSKSYSTNPRFQDRNENIIIALKLSCKATKNDDLSPGPNRRNTLIGLGGLAAILGGGSTSLAGPFWPDDGPIPGVSLLTTEFPLTSKADFPKALDSVIGVDVPRPRESRRSRKEKKELMVIDVELSHTDMPMVEFDVYVNGEHDNDRDHRPGQKTLIKAKLVGSFTSSTLRNNRAGCFKLGLDKIIEDLGAYDDEILEVSLVPRSGQEAIIVKDVRIEYSRN